MLGVQGIIRPEVAAKILPTLKGFQDSYYDKSLDYYSEQFSNHDDVHMNMEARLIDVVGMDVGGRMHTTRSRNDQVVLDSKMYARKEVLAIREKLIPAIQAFLHRAEGHTEDVMVGYTHFQHAQPISIAYWLSHYAAVLIRDLTRLKAAYDVCDENPLGSGALCGTSFPIDRMLTTRLLGFQKVIPHGLDATSSRDYMLESLSAAANVQVTLSRLAEELILWSSYEYSTVSLDDGFAMGSSMMPQKKNPGTCELLRGRSGRVTGLMTAAYTMMKGLPSGYNRDFHEDKEILIEGLTLVNRALEIIPALVETTTFNLPRLNELSYKNFATATEVANYLVAKHNVPFREAHHVVGSLVGDLHRAGKNFSDFDHCLDHIINKNKIQAKPEEIKAVLDPKSVMMSYNCLGGTGPTAVKEMLASFNQQLDQHAKVVAADRKRLTDALEVTRKIAGAAGKVSSAEQLKNLIPEEYRN